MLECVAVDGCFPFNSKKKKSHQMLHTLSFNELLLIFVLIAKSIKINIFIWGKSLFFSIDGHKNDFHYRYWIINIFITTFNVVVYTKHRFNW